MFSAASPDGRRVVFSSTQRLVRGDRDKALDVYLWRGGRTLLLSGGRDVGPRARAEFEGATPDARTVVFQTEDDLVAADGDSSPDLYLRGPAGLELVTVRSAEEVRFGAVSADGSRVYFTASQRLVAGDENRWSDVYEYRAGRVRWVSAGDPGGGRFLAVAADGSRVAFSSRAAFVDADRDNQHDVYARQRGRTRLLSPGGVADPCSTLAFAPWPCPIEFEAASEDASRVFFESWDRLLPGDADSLPDVYAHGPTGLTLVSTPSSELGSSLLAITPDGRRALFTGGETINERGDTRCSLYERRAGRISTVSIGPRGPVSLNCATASAVVSRDGSTLVFSTGETGKGESGAIYRRVGGRGEVVAGPPPGSPEGLGAFLAHVSADGARIVLLTARSLLDADRDDGFDLYSWAPRRVSLISAGPAGGNARHDGPPGAFDGDRFPYFGGASADGRRVFFTTKERLLRRDRNELTDLYERGPAGLRLISAVAKR